MATMTDEEWNRALPDDANFEMEARMSVRACNVVRCEMREGSEATVGMVRDRIAAIGGRKGLMKWPNIGKITADEIMAIMPAPKASTERELKLEKAMAEMIKELRRCRVDVSKYNRILEGRD